MRPFVELKNKIKKYYIKIRDNKTKFFEIIILIELFLMSLNFLK